MAERVEPVEDTVVVGAPVAKAAKDAVVALAAEVGVSLAAVVVMVAKKVVVAVLGGDIAAVVAVTILLDGAPVIVVVAEQIVASEEGVGMVVTVVMSVDAAVAVIQTEPAVAAERVVATYVGEGVALVIIAADVVTVAAMAGKWAIVAAALGMAAMARVGGAPMVSTAAPLSIPSRAPQ